MGQSCTIDLRVAGSNPAGQLLIYFHNLFPVLTKTLCRHSSLVPRSRIKAYVRKLRRCSPGPPGSINGKHQAVSVKYVSTNSLLPMDKGIHYCMIVKDNGKGQVTCRNKQINKYFLHYKQLNTE